jgi:hypothetical protein
LIRDGQRFADKWLARAKVLVAPVTSRRAIATVTFDNAGTSTMVTLDLAELRIGWRIRDIHARNGDLRAIKSHIASTNMGDFHGWRPRTLISGMRVNFILGILRSRGTMRSWQAHRRLVAGPHGLRRVRWRVCRHDAARCEDTRRRFGRTNPIWLSEGVLAERS